MWEFFLEHWVAFVLSWVAIGYFIGVFSLEVYEKWDLPDGSKFDNFFGNRLFLFPVNYLDGDERKCGIWPMVQTSFEKNMKGRYVLSMIVGGPLRILWLLFVMAVMILVATSFFLLSAVSRMISAGMHLFRFPADTAEEKSEHIS
ncbi:MAG: hypothetical protein HYT98_03385 [Candidatus Sungbacteria bacterium]|nr:hypothetical protein [Candidatus Sungbacteria bacterium]